MGSKRQERFRVVSVNDPAIDTERMTIAQMRAYYEKRDESLIVPFIKPGSKPVWFHIGEIKLRLWASYILQFDVAPVQHERAFLAGVDAIDNAPQEGGETISMFTPPKPSGYMNEEVLERYALDACTVEEIGAVALEHGFLARRTGRIYPLPHMCLVSLAQRAFLPAASSPSSPVPNSSSTSSENAAIPSATDPQPSSSASASGSPTDATATETPSTEAA